MIRLTDDGEGIHPDDVLLAVTSHATSKLTSAADLFRVRTMGFRGEALASIAEVSQFKLRTRQADRAAGTELEVRAGEIQPLRECGCPVGTTIEVAQLFCNTPVRRKYLRSSGTELGHICEQFTRIALANPRLHLVLRHNQKVVYELPATDRMIDRLRLFYGSELAEQLIWVEGAADGVRLWGYVAHPSQNKPTRKWQYLYLNGRWITDRSLQHALAEAYRGLVMVGRHPVGFLFLEIPPEEVDVNVHPTKSEVRFQDTQPLFRLILSTLRSKFLTLDMDSQLRVPAGKGSDAAPAASQTAPAARQVEFQQELANWAQAQLEVARSEIVPPTSGPAPVVYPPLEDWQSPSSASAPAHAPRWDLPRPVSEFQPYPDLGMASVARALPPYNSDAGFERPRADLTPALPLPPAVPAAAPSGTFADSVRAMQVHDCYLVVETDEGITVIDQHALHERIMYEQLRTRVLAGTVEAQRLLLPETVELSPAEAALVLEHAPVLQQMGFTVEEFGGQTVLLTSYPIMLGKLQPGQLLKDIAQQLTESGRTPTRRDLLDELLHMMSCKAAVKAGQRLTSEEIESLLVMRHLVDDAHHCPHGRPTALKLTRAELDRQFGRLGS